MGNSINTYLMLKIIFVLWMGNFNHEFVLIEFVIPNLSFCISKSLKLAYKTFFVGVCYQIYKGYFVTKKNYIAAALALSMFSIDSLLGSS